MENRRVRGIARKARVLALKTGGSRGQPHGRTAAVVREEAWREARQDTETPVSPPRPGGGGLEPCVSVDEGPGTGALSGAPRAEQPTEVNKGLGHTGSPPAL